MSKCVKQKVIVVGAGPVGALAALYAAGRGDDVEVYELRSGTVKIFPSVHAACLLSLNIRYILSCLSIQNSSFAFVSAFLRDRWPSWT